MAVRFTVVPSSSSMRSSYPWSVVDRTDSSVVWYHSSLHAATEDAAEANAQAHTAAT
jgi:hypothetical protein